MQVKTLCKVTQNNGRESAVNKALDGSTYLG